MGLLRLHFTESDLARTRIAYRPDALWELVLSANLLGNREGRAVFDAWRTDSRARVRSLPAVHRQLIRLVAPPYSDFPDLLTPPAGEAGIDAGIEAVLSTPRARLRRELLALGEVPIWAGPLVRGEPEAVKALGQAMRSYFSVALEPCWNRVEAQVEADRMRRARAFLSGGIDAVLDSLRPCLRWRAPVLEAAYPQERDIWLGGRGIVLIPSVFCWGTPVTLIDPELPPVVVYPVDRTGSWWAPAGEEDRRDGLAALLGPTRAALLRAAATGGAGGELARRSGCSSAVASYHLKVLREAGLVIALRDGPHVLYTATPTGHALTLRVAT
ncbi:helix-turn-helix domain-containing protein [Streptomyces sp. NRRL F-5123]|uniref:helix-turn-helix domain-containing protein n=1 Tax=Streptomyces sp. NRRL F-5123 TaxID=1463856 RepID=UPI001F3F3EBB|nr:helix-turn-helix domain-containing protein [Streptomyces sp. NRRL F-5123]